MLRYRRIVSVAAVLCSLSCAATRPRPEDRLYLDMAAETLGGEVVPLGGPGAVRLIDVWASWCQPCRSSMPKAAAVVRARAAEGVEEIALSVDEDLQAVQRYLAKTPVEGRVLHYRGGMEQAKKLGLHGIPLFFVLDREGRIVGAVRGNRRDLEDELGALITEALGPAAATAAAR